MLRADSGQEQPVHPWHVGKRDVERDGGGVKLPRQCERFGSSQRHQNLESLFSR